MATVIGSRRPWPVLPRTTWSIRIIRLVYAQVVDELQGGAVVKSFTYGHERISQRMAGGSLSFYQYDGQGSVRQLTSATGAISDAYEYDAFGNLIYHSGTTPNDYLFAGEQFDANLG